MIGILVQNEDSKLHHTSDPEDYFYLRQEGPRALDRSPESWHIRRRCIGLWVNRYDLKIFLFLALVAILCSLNIEGIMRNISVKLFGILVEGIMRNISVKLFGIFVGGIMRNISVKLFEI